jgi:hypothetical protein
MLDRKKLDQLAKKYDLPSITTWKQGKFIDFPQYRNSPEHWKEEKRREEQTFIRPGGGTNNALFKIDGAFDNANIAKYLEELGFGIFKASQKKTTQEALC